MSYILSMSYDNITEKLQMFSVWNNGPLILSVMFGDRFTNLSQYMLDDICTQCVTEPLLSDPGRNIMHYMYNVDGSTMHVISFRRVYLLPDR